MVMIARVRVRMRMGEAGLVFLKANLRIVSKVKKLLGNIKIIKVKLKNKQI